MRRWTRVLFLVSFVLALIPAEAAGKPFIRKDFFSTYPNAVGTQLDDLPSHPGHCGVCHFDFNGGGPRNPYGLAVEVKRAAGFTNVDAFHAIEGGDSDGDGSTNLTEITSTAYGNTPTFPGLSSGNVGGVLNVTQSEVIPYLTPSGASDTTPPSVTVVSPNGGGMVTPGTTVTVSYTAADAGGVDYVNVDFSDDSGATWEPVAARRPPTGSWSWFVQNLPGTHARIRVTAVDMAGNPGSDAGDADFTVSTVGYGRVPTTLRDMRLPGTQPFQGAVLDDPSVTCVTCHGNYDPTHEPWQTWRGSMMGQAARDPFFLACMAVAEQDAPSVGDLCLRCHTPGGWQEGRSADTGGGLLTATDRQGVQCDFCHRIVDPVYEAGVSPLQDYQVLAALPSPPLQYANGEFVNDPAPLKRGPYSDAQASHEFAASPIHRSSNLCGTCHDVSNPVFVKTGAVDYAPAVLDQEHPDMDLRNMFPVERTFSEWGQSEYATSGVYAPQFAGTKPDGIVSTCEDCHMADASAKGCNVNGIQARTDLGVHDFTGGNTFIPDVLAGMYPGEVDATALAAAKARAVAMLQKAATLEVTPDSAGITVRVTNETGHKLPSGYPEGRRLWLQVAAVDAAGQTVYESGAYDFATGVLTEDADAKVYAIHPGLSPSLASALGLPAAPSFHFVLNDTVYEDDRIPPRGFTNSQFETIQSPPVGRAYADGQYWDDTRYLLPAEAESVRVTLFYQSTSKEYVEFLRDENHTNSAGDDLYAAWTAHGRSTPVAMASETVPVSIQPTTGVPDANGTVRVAVLSPAAPNPFAGSTRIEFELARAGEVRLEVYDLSGRRVRSLVEGELSAGRHAAVWDGRDDRGATGAAGIYFIRLRTADRDLVQRAVRIR